MSSVNKNLKQCLSSGKLTIGSWITIGDTCIAEIMAKLGFDWLCVDMEHSAITLAEAKNIIQVVDLAGVIPMVRVGENDPNLIKRVMDAGARGVIVPMINTKEEAIRAVNSVKYPPIGNRGVGLARAQGYGLKFEEYKKWVDSGSIVIVQIEHIKAIDNLEQILDTDGVDASIIGPYDLSASLGYPGEFERPEVKAALRRYEEICNKLNKPMGIHSVPPDYKKVLEYVDRGYKFVAFSFDALFLGAKCKEELAKVTAKIRG